MHSKQDQRGFTLVELLVVMVIIILIVSFTVPALTGTLKGSQLSQAYPMTVSELNSARQTALAKNSAVEVRFYIYDNPVQTPVSGYTCRGFQTWLVSSGAPGTAAAGTMTPLSKVITWPVGVVFNAQPGTSDYKLSSMVQPSLGATLGLPMHPVSGTSEVLPVLPNLSATSYRYLAFQFRPNGSTTLAPPQASADSTSTRLWYFTLRNEHDPVLASGHPANYVTVQIDPFTGTVRTLRP